MRLPAVVLCALAVPSAFAMMPVAQQNALVMKYCAVCHTDSARNGGLSLQHFDAATVSPSLSAMMLSKLKNGAMGAAGIPRPNQATIDEFKAAFAYQARGADKWSVGDGEIATASVLRKAPSANTGEPEMYRLVLSCNASTQRGEMQVAWSPATKRGALSIAIDGTTPVPYKVEGSEHMGDGSSGLTGPASVTLSEAVLPQRSLKAGDLFAGESVEFSFSDLPEAARQSLAGCFSGPVSRYRQ